MSDTGGTAELAEALRELKGRSGLSYGVLAKRLHMSTSTLHRYCNGDAVPTEFAPVERLARLCRATGDEMVRVHRLWILADAERGKKAAAGSSGAGAAAPEAAPVPPGSVPSEPAPSEPVPPGSVPPGPVPSGPASSGPASSGPAAPDRPASPEPLVSLRSGDGDTGDADADATSGTSTASLRKRRRNVLIGVGAVLAVAASTVLVTHPWDGAWSGGSGNQPARAVSSIAPSGSGGTSAGADSGGAAKSPPATPPRSGAPGGADPSAPTGAPGQGQDSGGSKDGSTDGSKVGSEGGSKDSEAGSEGQGSVSPFSAAVRPFVYESPCSQFFLIDSAPEHVAPPPSEQDAPGWAASYKAVSADDQLVALTLQGRSKKTVVLQALHVRVVRNEAPVLWNRYAAGVGCGGNVDTKSFAVDLDAGRPSAAPHAGQRDFPYKISETDPEVFYVKARARTHDVTWYLELEWSSDGKRGIQRIDNHGKPFRTSGSAGRPLYVHPLGSTAWEKPLDDGSGEQYP
ncbi:helix-turn-helix domain-containing protein [Streptomyces sp. NPDC048442]|uniref:transcriptional regulator n=1 Tax=Streptomyces sp. NPDC048442 TaxID=3154823 RepID=UPI003423FE8F